jgi:hypothetical protein
VYKFMVVYILNGVCIRTFVLIVSDLERSSHLLNMLFSLLDNLVYINIIQRTNL